LNKDEKEKIREKLNEQLLDDIKNAGHNLTVISAAFEKHQKDLKEQLGEDWVFFVQMQRKEPTYIS